MSNETPPVSCIEAQQATATQFEASGADMVGQRLDYALTLLLPQMGLRGRKRSIESGQVLVNGRSCKAAQRLRKGDVVSLADAPTDDQQTQNAVVDAADTDACPADANFEALPRLLERQGEFCFFYKPVGLHTAALTGGNMPSLESMLPQLLAGQGCTEAGPQDGADMSAEAVPPQLMQRLDHGTSGIVCAALSPQAAKTFRLAEAAGRCEKRYVALLAGRLEEDFTVTFALRTDKRSKSRVLDRDAGCTRWTNFTPLHYFEGDDLPQLALTMDPQFHRAGLTLAGCRIRRGARHQIRAHAAAVGHPLWNDPLYADKDPEAEAQASHGTFYLHHGCLLLPGTNCVMPPPWSFLPEAVARQVLEWLTSVD
ncbi:pseudouridine synthase [Desulfovibrio desulfuricans]|uniref:pseudouridine synthase n=1 Tax=Desulfovibrio desulfuricans TaxID=876 RepID=UPI001AEACB68|nr:pseudouridine synthase [Desulfovibrio desulfuricans]MDD3684582.1 pseudouridine synthase [Desulfovibrio desulfuricans]QTO40806.1 pseudouridine synthase [Desulfovibrio desulfuricans]